MKAVLLILFAFCFLSSCKTRIIHVPVETIKTEKEYVDKWYRDSIYVQDSIIIKQASDTVFIEKYKYLYRDKLVRDSIFITDSIKVEIPYPVPVVKEINKLTWWQNIWISLGELAGGGLLVSILFLILRRR